MGLKAITNKRLGGWVGVLCCALFVVFASMILPAIARAAEGPLAATGYKMAGDATKMRIVVDFDREPNPRWFLLRGPHRLVIDVPNSKLAFSAKDLKARGLIKSVRYGQIEAGASRLILISKGPFRVDKLDVLKNEDGSGYRMAVDISAVSDREFDAALADQAVTTASTVSPDKRERLAKPAPASHKFTIVIDPGHGGVDGGAEGLNGTVEKNVTLAFAKELRDKLSAEGKYDISLTRDDDTFLRLDDRVRIARQRGANLFISIHADTIRLKGIRGATVYTVSDKASDPEEDSQEVTDILIDLIRRETHSFSMSFAQTLVGELGNSVGLINNPHRFAGFRVLKAPDVPSVLVELGYLSNAKDEAQLTNPEWRGKAADSISKAVSAFAASRVNAGG